LDLGLTEHPTVKSLLPSWVVQQQKPGQIKKSYVQSQQPKELLVTQLLMHWQPMPSPQRYPGPPFHLGLFVAFGSGLKQHAPPAAVEHSLQRRQPAEANAAVWPYSASGARALEPFSLLLFDPSLPASYVRDIQHRSYQAAGRRAVFLAWIYDVVQMPQALINHLRRGGFLLLRSNGSFIYKGRWSYYGPICLS
jgi:hypothetical protein